MNNYVQKGGILPFIVTAAAVASGQGIVVGNLFGVCTTSGEVGDSVELALEGVFALPKASADTPAKFANAYWDVSEGEVTTVSTDNILIGVFRDALGAGTTVADVRLNGASV